MGHSAACQPERLAWLRSGRYSQHNPAAHGVYSHFTAEDCRIQIYSYVGIKITFLALEARIVGDLDNQVEISLLIARAPAGILTSIRRPSISNKRVVP